MNSLTVTFGNVSSAPLDKGGGVSLEFSFLDRNGLENILEGCSKLKSEFVSKKTV